MQAAFTVHKELGPGLLESVYETCLCDELDRAGIATQRQVAIPIRYRGKLLDAGFRADIIVAGLVMVEVKAPDALKPVHQAQLLAYLKLSGLRPGYLINFTAPLIKSGIRRLII